MRNFQWTRSITISVLSTNTATPSVVFDGITLFYELGTRSSILRRRLAWTTWTFSRENGLQFEREERPILRCALRLPFVRHFFGSTYPILLSRLRNSLYRSPSRSPLLETLLTISFIRYFQETRPTYSSITKFIHVVNDDHLFTEPNSGIASRLEVAHIGVGTWLSLSPATPSELNSDWNIASCNLTKGCFTIETQ